jgi:hypothetical protein
MGKRYNILTRCLAALALMFVYVASTSAILVGATTSSAEAQWRGRGRGWGGRGWGYGGRGWGRGYGFYGGPIVRGRGCYWSPRWGRTICPY